MEEEQKRAGILSEGKDTTFINCVGIGPDAGIIEKGTGTKAIDSQFYATGKKPISKKSKIYWIAAFIAIISFPFFLYFGFAS